MSYRLLTTNITGGAAMPIKKGTLDLYNQEFELITREIGRISTGTKTTDVWILWGCFPTITGGTTYAFTEGAILYQNVILRVPAVTITLGGGQVPVFNLVTGNITSAIADPVLFSDNNTYNVHQDFSATITAATAGSGICNWSDAKYYNTDWKDESTSRFLNAYWRIYQGKLEFKGEVDLSTSFSPVSTWFTLPSWVELAQNISRPCFVSDIGSSSLSWGYLLFRIDKTTNNVIYQASALSGTAGAGARLDLSALNNIPLL